MIAKISSIDFVLSVYSLKPNSTLRPSSLSNKYIPDPSLSSLPKPSCGIGFPVI